MKTAAVSAPNAGQVEETVTRKRILPADAVGAQRTPEFWPYIEALKPEDWSPYRHKLFIYRYLRDDASGAMDPIEKNEAGLITMPNNEQVAIDNREEVEFAIGQKFGGGLFRLILKKGSERITETRVHIDAPRKAITPIRSDTGPQVTTVGDNSVESVAHHAITTIANQERTAVDVGIKALQSAGEVVALQASRFSTGAPAPPPSETDQMMKMLMLKMLERALQPPPDPLEFVTKVMGLVGTLNPGSAQNPVLGRIMDKAVENLLTPPVTGPVTSATAELVRQLPSVASYAAQAIHEWRLGSEAQRDTALAMSGQKPPAAVATPGRPNTITPSPTVLPPVQPPAQPTNGEATHVGAPSFEFIESRILNIMADSATVEEAAERAVEYLADTDENVIPKLVALGEAGLLQFFCSRPVLKPASQNLPKLQEFIRAFLRYASEPDGSTPANPQAVQ